MIRTQEGRVFTGATKNRIVASCILVFLCCCTLIASAASTYTVDVLVDGKIITVNTSEQDVNIIIQQAGVTLGERDKLDTRNFKVSTDADEGNKIIVLRATPITILDDGEVVAVVKVAGTVKDALLEAGVVCRPVDEMNFKEADPLEKDMVIEIRRAFSVEVFADGEHQSADFLTGTVADVLIKLNITLGENDEVNPSLNTKLRPGREIRVYRVEYEERTETETIKFKTVKKASASIYKGTSQIEQEGKNGSKTVVYKDKIVDGKVAKAIKVSEKIIEPAVNKIVLEGTKIKLLATATPLSKLPLPSNYVLTDGIPTEAIATITGGSTAYTADAGKGTASGVPAQSGYVAVDPKEIPYGTEMYIVTSNGRYIYGYCIAADTGNVHKWKKKGTVVDVFFDTKTECYQWGRKDVTIYILKWGSGKVQK
ncbi:MAG: DUF348 domain-containing protein [Ruminococcaceae bacterium]|nr:DUF348 domain-containing protein [Oscillospiraceae bacterium]